MYHDVLRSCYKSSMRLYRDSDLLTEGAWYFTPEGAKQLPYDTFIVSREWDDDKRFPWVGLGEVRARGKWVRGNPNPFLTGDHACGARDRWERGGLIAERGTIAVDEHGVPECCSKRVIIGGGLSIGWTALQESWEGYQGVGGLSIGWEATQIWGVAQAAIGGLSIGWEAVQVNSVPDGDYGAMTVSLNGTAWDLNPGVVEPAMIVDSATGDTILAGPEGAPGPYAEIPLTPLARDLLGTTTEALMRTLLDLGTLATQDGTFSGTSSGVNTGDQVITLTGAVTGTGGGSFATTLANSIVTYPKMQNMTAGRILGRSPGATDAFPAEHVLGNGIGWVADLPALDIAALAGLTAVDQSADELAVLDASASGTNKRVLPVNLFPVVILEDQKAQNTSGGTFTAGAWQTRTLNAEVTDTLGICVLASNQFVLTAGTYLILAFCPAVNVNRHQSRLYNVTGAATLVWGSSEISLATNYASNHSKILGRFTVAAAQTLRIEHWCQTTYATQGMGAEGNIAGEVYTRVFLMKVG